MRKILLTLAALTFASTAFAQQGLYNAQFPGWGPQGVRAATYYLCTKAQADANNASGCIASPVAITSDQAGNSSISQPVTVPSTGYQKFYAPPGNYALLNVASDPSSSGQQFFYITVPPDVLGNQALNDGYYTMPAPGNCFEAASTNVGSGDGTTIIDAATPAVKGSLSASGAANVVFTCNLSMPTRITSGKGAVIQDITFFYAVQTNSLDSWAATLKSFTGPAAGATETPASATLASFGGSLTLSTFTGNGAVSAAGSYYSQKITLGTPTALVDRQGLVLQLTGAHAGANAMIVTVPYITIHYTIPGV